MKASKLIEKLTEVIEIHGDVDVKCYPYDGQMNPGDIDELCMANNKVTGWNNLEKSWDLEPCETYVILE